MTIQAYRKRIVRRAGAVLNGVRGGFREAWKQKRHSRKGKTMRSIRFSITKQGEAYVGKFRCGGAARAFHGASAMDVADMCAEFAGEAGYFAEFRDTKAYLEMKAQMRAVLGR